MNDHFEILQSIAEKLNCLPVDPMARVNFELMSGGLVWSDEMPRWEDLEPTDCWSLRGVWRYRTSVIEGAPEEKYRPFWDEAQKLFPNWPGFLAERRSAIWQQTLIEQKVRAHSGWESLDARFERQQAALAQ